MWDMRFGGSGKETLEEFRQTNDGGFILGGFSVYGLSGDKTQAGWGVEDYWIVKTDSSGIKQWDKDFGGTDYDELYSIKQSNDNGYILCGLSWSQANGDKTEPSRGQCDFWVIKTDALGNKQWDKVFGGNNADGPASVMQTSDGGYILGGSSFSGVSGDKTQPNWDWSQTTGDFWIIKIDSLGNKKWDKDFGGLGHDVLYATLQTSDGGFILGGNSYSGIGGNKTDSSFGGWDYWILKTDSLGNKEWDKDFGGTKDDGLYSLQQTFDGGYILGGLSRSEISGNKSQPLWGGNSDIDFWVIKIDSLGNKIWDKDYGGFYFDELYSIDQSSDSGFLFSGWSNSLIGGDKTENNLGQSQTWVLKTDANGNIQWDKTLFTLGVTKQGMAMQTKDGCYAMATHDSSGIGGLKSQPSQGDYDYWIIKFCDTTLTTNIAKTPNETEQLLLFPNPSEGEFKIYNEKLIIDRIEISNTLGEIMKNVVVDRRLSPDSYRDVDCRLLPSGIYFVKVFSENKVLFEKMVIESMK